MAPPPDALVAFASGVPLIVLGGFLLALRPRRPAPLFFGAFAILWGLQVALANLGRVLDDADVHRTSFLASFALLPPASFFLAQFAARVHGGRRIWILPALFGALAAAALATVLVAPEAVVAQVLERNGRLERTRLGPAAAPLFQVPFHAAFYVSLALLYLRYRAAPAGSARHRYRGLLLALALFTSYRTAWNLLIVAGVHPQQTLEPSGAVLFLTLPYALGLVLLLGLFVHLAVRPAPPESIDVVLLGAFATPALVALAQVGLAFLGPDLDTAGFWRLATVAALVYALARHQLFDLDLRLKRIAAAGLPGLALGFGGLVTLAQWAGGGPTTAVLVPLVAGTAGAGVTWAGRAWIGERLFPGVVDAPDYLYQRKLDVYRDALERSIDEPGPRQEEDLRRLRRGLGLSEREHQILEYVLRRELPAAAAAPAPAMPRVEPGARLLERYRVERLLGEGAHGRTFLAFDERDERAVVLKAVGTSVLGGRAARLLVREARLIGSLRHPNIIAVHDVLEATHEAIIVMEYADGGNLYGLLRRRGRLTLAEATRMLRQTLSGLEAAHAKGIVHRDVKPENLLVMTDGTFKLADFGVAREADREATGLTGGAVGTLLYMSPEQVRGRDVDARSDLYAAAVVFHQALTGRHYLPIAGKDDFQVRQLILRQAPRLDVGDQPAWVRDLLQRALAKDAARRFATATAMRRALVPR